jgi:hypothetical protein
MEEIKTTKEIVEAKAIALAEEYKCFKVHPIVFKADPNDPNSEEIIGYIKEPSRMAKMAVMDKSVIGGYGACEEILDSVLIKEHSDPRFSSESQEFDDIHMGLVMAVYNLIKFKTNTLKKK